MISVVAAALLTYSAASAQIIPMPIIVSSSEEQMTVSQTSGSEMGRYGFLVNRNNRNRSLLVDKVEGRVWLYISRTNTLVELEKDRSSTMTPDGEPSYQLYMGPTDAQDTFLLNIRTGEMWKIGPARERIMRKVQTSDF